MRFVKIEQTDTGYLLDPNAYLDWLEESAASLPAGAREFASDPEHYDVHSSRCVKDLKLNRIWLNDSRDHLSMEVVFVPNRFKHDQGLVLRYPNVVVFSINVTSTPRGKNVWPDTRRLGDFQLDEILPHEKGCSHEIQMTGGSIRIVSSDLHAGWRDEANDVDGGDADIGAEPTWD